jgi:predicted transposase/invertase (TIGR01784 family)
MEQENNGRVVSALNDLAFKKAFSSENNVDVLAGLIQDFFGFRPKEITISNPYSIKTYEEKLRQGDIRVLRETLRDVGARLETADFFAELQVQKENYFDVRSIYYPMDRFCGNYNAARLTDTGYEPKRSRYASLRPVYTLNILGHRFFGDEDALRIFGLYDAQRRKAFEREYLKIAYFEIGKRNIETEHQRYWRDYFLNRPISEKAPDYIRKAARTIDYANLGKEERAMIDWAERAQADYESGLYTAYEDGQKSGVEIGEKRGEKRGRTESSQDVARRMKAGGEPFEKITRYTNISAAEIAKL